MNTTEKTIKPFTRFIGAVLGTCMLLSASLASAVTLKDISYSSLPDNKMEISLQFDGQPPKPKGYSIEQPARIALDLPGVSNGLKSKHHNLGTGNARSVTVVEARDRTRLIINEIQLTDYSTQVNGNKMVITLGEKKQNGGSVAGNQPESGGTSSAGNQGDQGSATVASSGKQALEDVSFHRGDNGGGQIVVKLSDPSIPVDVSKQGGQIVAKFVGAALPEKLHRRLDVTDFATPVKFVDTEPNGNNTLMTIEPKGNWEYLAYQADNEFTINVKPVTREEQAKQQKQAFQYTGEKLSLNFQDIEVRSVLQLIADFTNLNLVASDTVKGTITLRLKNVPWDQALDLILKTKGLDKRKIGNVLLVAPADEIAAREQQELESRKKIAALAPLRTEYVRVNYAKAEDLEKLIKQEGSLLTDRGSITVDKRTNTLIIQDTQDNLNQIKDVISKLDIPVQQVLIEARVVTANNDLSDEFGIRWGGLGYQNSRMVGTGRSLVASGRLQNIRDFNTTNQKAHSPVIGYNAVGVDTNGDGTPDTVNYVPGGHESVLGYSALNLTTDQTTGGLKPTSTNQLQYTTNTPQDLMVDLGVNSAQATRFALGFTSVDSGLLELELSAVESEGEAEIIATPKVLTADQQPAVIASGQQIPYQNATSSGATSVQFKNAELRLEVTPHITPDNRVIMDLKVNNDTIGQQTANGPTIDTNRVETTVLVNNGETVVLGGIFQHQKVKSVTKTPFLGDLPWIGNLFRKKTNTSNKQELLIFITPRLVKDQDGTVASR